MGAASSGLALTKTFKQIEEWSFSKAMNLHKDYRRLDLDFGLTENEVALLVSDNKAWARDIVTEFEKSKGATYVAFGPACYRTRHTDPPYLPRCSINALSFISSVACCCEGDLDQRINSASLNRIFLLPPPSQ